MFAVCIICFAAIAAIDVPKIVRGKRWRELIMYALVFLPVFALGIVLSTGTVIPSPIKTIQSFYRDVLHLSFKAS
jgi:hypothetical protein